MTNNEKKQVRVLIVDDEVDLCEVISLELTDAGFEVVTVCTVSDARAKILSEKFDVVLSDISIPGESGVDLLKWANESLSGGDKPKFILMSGYSSSSIVELFEYGIEALFSKPLCFESLIKSISRVVESTVISKGTRKYVRYDVDLIVKVATENGPKDYRADLVNIGRGGFFVHATDMDLVVGDTFSFQILTPLEPDQLIKGKAICRWVREGTNEDLQQGFGAEIQDVEDRGYKAILELINSCNTNSPNPVM